MDVGKTDVGKAVAVRIDHLSGGVCVCASSSQSGTHLFPSGLPALRVLLLCATIS